MKDIIFSGYHLDQYPVGMGELKAELESLTGIPCTEESEECDREHWLESLCLLRSIKKYTQNVKVYNWTEVDRELTKGNVLFGVIKSNYQGDFHNCLFPEMEGQLAAQDYYRNLAFIDLAGRNIELADSPKDDGQLTDSGLETVLSKAESKKFIKFVASPKRLNTFTFDPSDNVTPNRAIYNAYGMNLMMHLDIKEAFLVQEHVDMEYECRFFVIGGQVVGGSPCVESYTPMDLNGQDFMPHEVVRGDGVMVIPDPNELSFLRKYVEYAKTQLTLADSRLDNFTIDVARVNGAWVIIELNSFQNAGMFALNTDDLVFRVLTRYYRAFM